MTNLMNGKMDGTAMNSDMFKYRAHSYMWKVAMCYTKALAINVGYNKLFSAQIYTFFKYYYLFFRVAICKL